MKVEPDTSILTDADGKAADQCAATVSRLTQEIAAERARIEEFEKAYWRAEMLRVGERVRNWGRP